MPYLLKVYLKYPWVIPSFGVALIMIGASWWYVVAHIHPDRAQVFLHYNVLLGVDLAGSWQELYTMPAVATVLLAVNFVCSAMLFKTERTLARMIAVTTAVIAVFFFIGIYTIVGLNI